jgi:signal transduction histidine kinase
MLYEFLIKERESILAQCKQATLENLGAKQTSVLMEDGLPVIFDQLVEVLRRDHTFGIGPESGQDAADNRTSATKAAKDQGKEYLRLDYTVSEVVHSYGALCQAITGTASHKNFKITSTEFRHLNLALDTAIAEAVTEFQKVQTEAVSVAEVKRLGFLAHELRNSLMSASLALEMIESGGVGIRSATSSVLGRSLQRMKELIDTSLTEVRLRIEPVAHMQRVRVGDIISDVEATATRDAQNKNLRLVFDSPGAIELDVDRQLIVSALANLVQNAIKFTRPESVITVRTQEAGNRVLLEVEDECGGIKEEKIEELFRPFTQQDLDRTGVGLGLAISRKAIELNNGTLSAHNHTGKGCVFTIDLPKAR